MLLYPCEPVEELEFDYAIIDLNLNASFFYILKDHLISLAPDNAKKNQQIFPYLLRLNSIARDVIDEIKSDDFKKISKNLMPFLLFRFKSKPIAEPDLVKHLKNKLIYEGNGKKYLYRFYDPRVWVLLNFFQSKDFSQLNRLFEFIEINCFKGNYYFKNILVDLNLEVDNKLIEKISLINRVIGLLKLDDVGFNEYMVLSKGISEYINILKKKNIKILKKDLVVVVYHIFLIGEKYIGSHFFNTLINNSKGYEQASKGISKEKWFSFFEEIKLVDNNLIDRMMYGY